MSGFELFKTLNPSIEDNCFIDQYGSAWFMNYDGKILRHDANDANYIRFSVNINKNESLLELKERHDNILQAEKLLRENGYEVKKIK